MDNKKIEVSEKIERIYFKATFCGKIIDNKWDHYLWNIEINGQYFTYRTGLGHFTPKFNTKGRLNKVPFPIKRDNINGKIIQQERFSMSGLDGWLHVPTKLNVLNCLFSDSSAIYESFENWADNFGYSSDSINAFEVYRSCVESYKKLKKSLGDDYDTIRLEIENLACI